MRWWACFIIVLSCEGAFAETPGEALQHAFKNADAATHKRSDLTYKIDTASIRHVLTIVRPDRTHLLVTPASGPGQEAIVIGRALYTKQKNTWVESRTPPQVTSLPDPTAGLQEIFASLTERPLQMFNGREQRVFGGKVRWQAGRNVNAGTVEILVDRRRMLPTRTSFMGQCATRACSFIQTMEFNTSLTISAPIVASMDAIQLYATTSRDRLAWREHANAMVGAGPLGRAITFRNDFATRYRTVIAAIGQPVFYAVTPSGDLFWLRHLGYRDGSDRWLGPIKIGNGWNSFDKIIAGENGVIYGRLPDGRLRWQQHRGHLDGAISWTAAHIVGTGWHGFIDIFAGSAGTIYGIKPNGDLVWHRHLGHETGAASWIEPSRKVGNGWQDIRVLSAGRGVIYGVRPNGELTWFRHHGYLTGEDWSADSIRVDTGWRDFKHVVAVRSEE
jgi:hypothetical protein